MAQHRIKIVSLTYKGGNLYHFRYKLKNDKVESFNVYLVNDDWYVEIDDGLPGEIRPLSRYEQCSEDLDIINKLYIPLTLRFSE